MEHFLEGIAWLRHFNATIFFNQTLNLRTDMQKSYVYCIPSFVMDVMGLLVYFLSYDDSIINDMQIFQNFGHNCT